MQDSVVNRFIRYVKVHTTSKEGIEDIPSTKRQLDLANILVKELKELGLNDASVNENCIVTATLPSNLPETENVPVLCFNAHMDTSPEEPGENVQPNIVKNYQGGDIVLPGDNSIMISPSEATSLEKFIGSDIITSDGTTLLGADDKAGIAEIMTAVSILINEPGRKHGTVKILFTSDEEVGKGTDALDVPSIGADYAFTIDGDEMGVFEIENFNAANGTLNVKGYNIHPGYAHGKMINAVRIISEFIANFPAEEAPETTKEYQGFYHPYKVEASVNEGVVKFILRDFDHGELLNKIVTMKKSVEGLKTKYPGAEIYLDLKESYRNMKEIIVKHPKLVSLAREAIEKAGVEIIDKPIRGGTDGARMSFKGLPTPNIFSGGIQFHSKKEFIPVIALEKAVDVILNIIEMTAGGYLQE